MRLEVEARPLQRSPGPRRLAASPIDLGQVQESARLGLEVAPLARRLQLPLEVRLGALDLAAPEQRQAGQEVHALAQPRLARRPSRATQVHQRLPIVAALDQQRRHLRLDVGARLAVGQPLQLLAQPVQSLNVAQHADAIVQESDKCHEERKSPPFLTTTDFQRRIRVG